MSNKFKDLFRDGVYTGPAIYQSDEVNTPPGGLAHLDMDGLVEIDNLFLPERCSSVSLKKLRVVTGPLSLTGDASVTLDSLERVGGNLYADNPSIQTIPKLRCVGDGRGFKNREQIMVNKHPVPYMPELDGKTKVGRKPLVGIYEEDPYKTFVQLVESTPELDLVTLRNMKPYLAHLVDHRLKGET